MSLKLCVLGSSSSGNCALVASPTTRILIDAGLTGRETENRLGLVGVDPGSVSAICVSHDHGDHIRSLGVLHRKYGIPLYANSGTIDGAQRRFDDLQGLPWNVFATGQPFDIGDLALEPFSVPHDAYDPVAFIVSNGQARLGIVSDMGMPTELIRTRLAACNALVLESNHDETSLKESGRPWSLKQRIAGRQGHLSNQGAAQLLAEIATPSLRAVFLAHLSSDCNDPDLAVKTVTEAVRAAGHDRLVIKLTYADKPSDIFEL